MTPGRRPERHHLTLLGCGLEPRWWVPAALAVAARPGLWPIAAVQAVRVAPTGWWRRWPPVPRPDPAYLRFRLQTAYGDSGRHPESADVVAYLRWCRDWGRSHRSGPSPWVGLIRGVGRRSLR